MPDVTVEGGYPIRFEMAKNGNAILYSYLFSDKYPMQSARITPFRAGDLPWLAAHDSLMFFDRVPPIIGHYASLEEAHTAVMEGLMKWSMESYARNKASDTDEATFRMEAKEQIAAFLSAQEGGVTA